MRIRFLRLRALQLSLCLCCLSSATNAIAQTAQGGVAPGRSYSAPASSTLLTSSASVAGVCTNADVLETDLWTYNLAANTLNEDGKTIRITAWGDYGATANTKIVHLYAGGTALTPATALANNGTSWVVQGWVTRTAAAQELGKAVLLSTGGTPNATTRLLTSDTTAIIPLKITGTNGTAAASDICFRGVNVSLEQTTTNNIVTSTGGPVANPILLANGVAAAPALGFASEPALGFYRSGSNSLVFSTTSGTDVFRISNIGPIVNSSSTLSWGSTGISGPDTFLARDGANILTMRNGVNAQAFKLYNTFTDAANYERGGLAFIGNELRLMSEAAGTGTARNVLILPSNGGTGWRFTTSGLQLSNDNLLDIGASGANRPRTLYLGTSLVVGSNFSVSSGGTISTSGGSGINFSGVSRINSSVDGNITIWNQAQTDFTMLQFGGTGVGFPAIKKSGTALQARLADDSGYTDLVSQTIQPQSSAITSGAGTGITVGGLADVRTATYKVTITSAAFTCLALTCDVTVGTLPAKTKLEAVYADLTTTFACAATCTTATLSFTLGSTAGGTDILSTFDADAAVLQRGLVDADLGTALARATAIQGGNIFSWTAATPLSLRLTSATGNIGTGAATNLSQGSITVYLVTTRIP